MNKIGAVSRKENTELKSSGNYVPNKEILIFGIAGLGQGMIYTAMSSYVSDFYLNVMQLSPLFVMLLMLLAKIWDAINDPIMGIIVEKNDSKFGKYKPYVIYTVLPIAVLTFFMFYAPDFTKQSSANYNELGTYFYVALIYVFWGMTYTVSDVPFWSLPNTMTPSYKERGKIISLARTLNGVGSVVPMALVMFLGYTEMNYETRYLIMALTSAICGGALFIASYFTTKERVKIPKIVKSDTQNRNSIKLIFSCKPLVLVLIMGVLAFGRYMYGASAIHVSRYTFFIEGMSVSASQSTVQLIFSLCTAAGMFGTMLLTPLLIKKFDYKKLVITTCVIGGCAGILGFIVGLFTQYSIWALIPFLIISSIPTGMLNVISHALVCDCLDYMELKMGRRENALGAACQSFINKFDNAIATTLIIAMYMIIGLNVSDMASAGMGEMVDPTTLPSDVRLGMYSLVTIIPAISMFICIIPMLFYKISGKNKEKMMQELSLARKERGIE